MLILGQKGENLDQKGFKMGVARFFPDCKPQFFKEDHNIGFYTNKPAMLGSLSLKEFLTKHTRPYFATFDKI